jgi:hypothetical protein
LDEISQKAPLPPKVSPSWQFFHSSGAIIRRKEKEKGGKEKEKKGKRKRKGREKK